MERADAEGPRRDHAWRRLRIILTGLVFCRGIVLLCVFPTFEGWDEYQHVGYIVYCNETGRRPWLGQADVPASLLARLPAFPHCISALRQIGSLGAVDYTTFWGRARQGNPPVAAAPAAGPIGLYQAQHGPLYYRLVGPLFESLGGVGDLKRSIGGLRLVNLILTAGSVWLALGIIARLVRDRRLTAFCGLLIATQPLFLINGVRVANDALGVFLATASIGWALNSLRRHPFASSLGLGILVGLAVLAKSVHFGLIPFIAACWLWTTLRPRDGHPRRLVLGRAFGMALALTCGFLVMTQSEFRANWTRFGSLTAMQEAVRNRAGRVRPWRSAPDRLLDLLARVFQGPLASQEPHERRLELGRQQQPTDVFPARVVGRDQLARLGMVGRPGEPGHEPVSCSSTRLVPGSVWRSVPATASL